MTPELVVVKGLNLLAGVCRLVKAVFTQFGDFQVVLVGQPADGLGADPVRILAGSGGADEEPGRGQYVHGRVDRRFHRSR